MIKRNICDLYFIGKSVRLITIFVRGPVLQVNTTFKFEHVAQCLSAQVNTLSACGSVTLLLERHSLIKIINNE